ncbi:IS4 family transposase [Acidobacteriota bacterium]
MLSRVQKKRLTRWAKRTGFRKRKGKLRPYEFLVLMTIGQLGMKHPSLAGMVAAIEARISRVALHRRFSKAAVAFLHQCLRFVLQQKFRNLCPIQTKLLRRFHRVLIADSSSWDVSENLRDVLPGSGGDASSANCKLQVVYDYKHSELGFLDVTAGTVPDNRYTDHLPGFLDKDDLLLIDQGYFKLKTLAAIVEREAFFLTRFFVGTKLKDVLTQAPIDLPKCLSILQGNACEMQVSIGEQDGGLSCRLIALRVSEPVANDRRRRLKKGAKKKSRTVSKLHLSLCDWTLLITNVSEQWLPLEMVRALYTLRWQIELLFKQLKSILRVHQSATAKEHRLRCELYGKLIAAVIVHRIHAAANNSLWNTKRREISMEKLYKRLQERAFAILRLLLRSVVKAVAYLFKELKRILRSCLKERQPSRMTTLEMIEAQVDPMLDIESFSLKKRAA